MTVVEKYVVRAFDAEGKRVQGKWESISHKNARRMAAALIKSETNDVATAKIFKVVPR